MLPAVRAVALAVAALLLAAAPAAARPAERPWPPAAGPGTLFAHYGEEHWNDADGLTVLPKIVEEVSRYDPVAVTMSGDKDNNGSVEELTRWKEVMGAYDRAGIPYFAAVGNHDRLQGQGENAGVGGGALPVGDTGPYLEVFKDRPYPFGDAPPYRREGFAPVERPADDPGGAATHYAITTGPVTWVFIDNGCYGIVNCEPLQNPPDGAGLTQYEYLRARAREADDAGRLLFVVMHMPTRDVGDQEIRDPIAFNHVMGKGTSPDNEEFERVAEELGVDGVFLGHIKGQLQYRGRGGIPYYIDGGAGGELYTKGPVGVDHGYWHGFRLVRVDGGRVTTDAVPIFVPGDLRLLGPDRVARGETVRLAANGRQPVFNDPAKVEALELRDPDPTPKTSGAAAGIPFSVLLWMAPLGLVVLAGVVAARPSARRVVRAGVAVGAAGAVGAGALAVAGDGIPDATPRDALPNPARIFTSSDPLVLVPVASDSDDPRRDEATQTADGGFRAICPGRAHVSVTAGWEEALHGVSVASAPGPIVRSAAVRRERARRGSRVRLARLRLRQPARVIVRVRPPGGRPRVVTRRCEQRTGPISVRLRTRARGRWKVSLAVESDRRTVVRRAAFRVR
jgi:Calcineurin-like phosphoesterase